MQIHTDWLNKKPSIHRIDYDIDFFKLFAYIHEHYSCSYLFESISLPRHQDRFHTLGFNPKITLKARGNSLIIDGEEEELKYLTKSPKSSIIKNINPYQYLTKHFNFQFMSQTHLGGLIGYFSHEAVNYFEPSFNLKEHKDFSNFYLGLYTDGLIYDTTTQELSYYTYHKDCSEKIKNMLKKLSSFNIPHELEKIDFLGHSKSKKEFLSAVEHTKKKIQQGYSFQAEVGFKSHYNIIGNKLAIYHKLRTINPGPYMFFIKFHNEELLGSSPEILISSKDKQVLTTPTAGTRPRGKNNTEDIKLARELLNDPKEIAEHNMLIDLHRNDLARVCQAGTVKISALMYIIRFSHVQHIVSNITGILEHNKTSYDLLASIFPGGVVTGAPKIETIKIIDYNEKSPRGPYGGAIGRFSFNGDCDFCLPIRSIFCFSNHCFIQTSAGIVYDSIAEKEYIEVTKKLEAMLQTLKELKK